MMCVVVRFEKPKKIAIPKKKQRNPLKGSLSKGNYSCNRHFSGGETVSFSDGLPRLEAQQIPWQP